MRHRICVLIVNSILLAAAAPVIAADDTKEGFNSLFNGKTFDGWHLMNGAKFVDEDVLAVQPTRESS